MNERDIFQGAIDNPDPAQRQSYLDRACGNDAALRARIEALLFSHESASHFLKIPAVEQLHPTAGDRPLQTADFSSEASGGKAGEAGLSDDDFAIESRAAPDLSFLAPSSQPGSMGVLGHYEILQLLGQGAFGVVFKAFDEKLHRYVAIKVMNPALAATSPPRKRFLREARSAAAIKHENVVQVYSVEEHPLPYLVMEYVDGQTLKEKMDRSGPLEAHEILHLGRQIASGLAAAHAQGLIHRDIKPGNILIEAGSEQKVKITDFGLARAADDATMTRTGVISGTPMFMAPEQAQGLALDARTDLFSLGSVLYQLASGRPPFRGPTAIAVLKRVADESPRPIQEILPEVPDWLCAIVAKLHAKAPGDRFQTAKEVAELLARCQTSLQQQGRVELTGDLAPHLSNSAAETKVTPAGTAIAFEGPALYPKRRLGGRHWAAAAAVLLLVLCAGLGTTEATGVTNVRGTVIRLFSPGGTLVVEVDDPGVSVSVDGEELVITGTGAKEIRLKPGQYKVLASKDGKVVSQELVTVTKNGRQVVRVSREALPVAEVRPQPGVDRRPLFQSGGEWRVEGSELVQSLPQGSFTMFGDPAWTDYTLEVEGSTSSRNKDINGFRTIFRAQNPENHRMFDVGNYKGTITDACFFKEGKWGRSPGCLLKAPYEANRWYQIKVEVRGPAIRCWVDDKLTFAFSDDSLPSGMIGLCSGDSPTRWRNLKVTAPDGKALWQGFPDLPVLKDSGTSPQMIESDRPVATTSPFDETEAKAHQQAWAKFLRCNIVEENSLGMNLTLVPPGKFLRGSAEGKTDGIFETDVGENPQHLVELTRPFVIATMEATQEQFEKLMARNPSEFAPEGPKQKEVDGIATQKLPVEMVTWFDAIEFCNKLSEREGFPPYYELKYPVRSKDGVISAADVRVLGGLGYRLPTEAEWEFACRSGTTTPFSFEFDYGTVGQYGWFGYDSGRPHQVGTRKPNAFGLHDMHGNVFEWCGDWFGNYSADVLQDPTGPATGTDRVARGGSYNYLVQYHRSAFRGFHVKPGSRLNNLGFRVARFVSSPDAANFIDNPDRRAAEYILSIPREHVVTIQVNDVDHWIGKSSDLPAEPFRLTGVFVEWASKLDDAGLANFEGCRHVKILRLWGTQATEKGLAHFKDCHDLHELSLTGDPVNDSALKIFKGRKLNSLHVQTRNVTDAGLANFQGSQLLTTLAIAHSPVTDQAMAYFKENKKLKHLSLGDTQVTDAGLVHFQGCKDLEDLTLFGTRVSNAGLIHFQDCKQLAKINLAQLPLVTDVGLRYFENCTDLTHLDVSGTSISDAGLAHLSNMKKLTFLKLDNTNVTDVGLVHLKSCQQVGELHLWQTRVTGTGFVHLKDLPNLSRLYLAECPVTDENVGALSECLKLRTLGLTKTRVSAAAVQKLTAAIPLCEIEYDDAAVGP